MTFTIEEASFVSFFVQCVTYGIFASLFAQSTSIILARWKKSPDTRRVNTMLLIVSVLMFLLSTVYISMGLYRYPTAFGSTESGCGRNSAQITDWLESSSLPSFIVGTGAYGFQTVFGDGFMIYRTYTVWGGYLPVCVPAMLTLLVSTVSGITFTFISSHSSVWVVVFLWLTLFTNGCCTALIAGRIIWLQHEIKNIGGFGRDYRSNVGPAVTVIVESGAIYSFSLAIVIALYYEHGLSEQNFALHAMPQVMGIIFSFIIIRVASRVSNETIVSEFYAQRTQRTDTFHSTPPE